MKFLAIFMFSIVIGLSVVPCCTPIANNNSNNLTKMDRHCCEEETCEDTEETTNENNNEEDGCNSCSPFFSCGSCAGFTAQIDFIKLNHFSFTNSIAYNNFNLQIHSDFFETKWQPPKIS